MKLMSFFDLLFPEWATATHLRTLTEQNQLNQAQQRVARNRSARMDSSANKKLEQRIESLESELGQAALVIEALMTKLEEKEIATKGEFEELIREIDARDGVVDGRITPPAAESFESNRDWGDTTKTNSNFPDS